MDRNVIGHSDEQNCDKSLMNKIVINHPLITLQSLSGSSTTIHGLTIIPGSSDSLRNAPFAFDRDIMKRDRD